MPLAASRADRDLAGRTSRRERGLTKASARLERLEHEQEGDHRARQEDQEQGLERRKASGRDRRQRRDDRRNIQRDHDGIPAT